MDKEDNNLNHWVHSDGTETVEVNGEENYFPNNKEAENMGTIVAVGPGKKLSSEKRDVMPVEVGQRIRFGTMNDDAKEEYLKFTPITHNGEKCLIMSWQDVCWVDGE